MSPRNQEAVRLAQEGVAPTEIARRQGRKPSAVVAVLKTARLRGEAVPSFEIHGYRDDREHPSARYVVLAQAGVCPKEIALLTGRTQAYVTSTLSRARFQGVPVPRFDCGGSII